MMICGHSKPHHSTHLLSGLILLLILSFGLSGHALANNKYASLVMDADTGVILHQRYADKMLHPASITKVMTLLMVFDALDKGTLTLNDKIRVSRHAASMVPSKLNLPVGSHIRVRDAIYALVTKSANDVAVAVAEKIGKTETRFAVMMTKKARELGMNRTRFMNASGLHHPKQVTTARDMAKMGRYLIAIQPRHYRYFATQNFSYKGQKYRNHNRLLGQYDGMDGIKTGYIQASGFNLLASAKRNNRRLIGVVFGGRTSKTRNAHMREILDDGFRKINSVRIARAPLPVRNPRRQAQNDNLMAMAPAAQALPASQLTKNLLAAEPKIITHNPPQDLGSTELKTIDRLAKYKNTRFEVAQISASQHKNFLESPHANNEQPVIHKFMKTKTLGTLKSQKLQNAALTSSGDSSGHALQNGHWAIQIGAYTERETTDQILNKAQQKLPGNLRYAKATIAPISAQNGWIYRAWLTGFSETDAKAACIYYNDCIIIEPKAH